jgi:hypothetical protein
VFLHVLGAGAELRSGERAIPPAREWVGRQDVPSQVDGQMTGTWSVRSSARRSDDTDARKAAVRRFGRSDRRAQGDC